MKKIFALLIAIGALMPTVLIAQSYDVVPDSVELEFLRNFYDSLNGDLWINRSGWPDLNNWPTIATSVDFDSWYGVGVSNGDITQLILDYNNLQGAIPQSISSLQSLQHISLRNNNISGELPSTIGGMGSLSYISLSSNNISGELPDSIGYMSSLKSLYLYGNNLIGSIPESYCNLSSLEYFYVPRNGLNGTIPACIGQLGSLKELVLEYNQLSGNIPAELGYISTLATLYLNHNQLSGSVPVSFGDLSVLKTLRLDNNDLEGRIPDGISSLANLTYINIEHNDFYYFPSFSGNANSGNISVSLANNNISEGVINANLSLFSAYNYEPQNYGTVPDSLELAILKNLYDSLGGDNWDDNTNWPSILNWPDTATAKTMSMWYGLTFYEGDLIKIQLNANNLTGPLPKSLPELPDLEGISLSTNYITGSIPSEYGRFSNLLTLDLGHTLLTDSIPPELGDIETLQWLDLRNTLMVGPIPSNLGSLTQLKSLYLRQNKFTGGIPPKLGNLAELVTLDLFDNPLGDAIPESLGRLQNLQSLNLIRTGVEGTIPDSLGFLTSLKALYLHQNKLTGEIPSTFCNLTALEYFYVPQNGITGQLPSCMGLLPKLKEISIVLTGISGIPDFTQHPAKGTLGLHCEYAALSPGEIEKNMDSLSHSFSVFSYNNQKYTGPGMFEFDAIGSLLIPSVDGGAHGNYMWEKKNTTGAWENVDIQNENLYDSTFYKESISSGDTGIYRFTINNPWIGNTYISSPLEVKLFSSQDVYAITSGNWEDPLIWSDAVGGQSINRIPRSVDRIYIKDQALNINNDTTCKAIKLMNGTVASSLIIEAVKLTVSQQIEVEPACSGCEIKLNGDGSIFVGEL